jgi:hypothetical protein
MAKYLDVYWERGGRRSDEIAILCGNVQGDPAS